MATGARQVVAKQLQVHVFECGDASEYASDERWPELAAKQRTYDVCVITWERDLLRIRPSKQRMPQKLQFLKEGVVLVAMQKDHHERDGEMNGLRVQGKTTQDKSS